MLVCLLALLPVLLIGALMHLEAPLPWLMRQVAGLQMQGLTGSLASGQITIDRMEWLAPGNSGKLTIEALRIEQPALRWRLDHRRPLDIEVQAISARDLQWHSAGVPGPLRPPVNVELPLQALVRAITVDRVGIDGLPPVLNLHARLELGADQGRQHRVEVVALDIERMRWQGRASLMTTGPLQMQATLTAGPPRVHGTSGPPTDVARPPQGSGTSSAPPLHKHTPAWQVELHAQGPLRAFGVVASLSGSAGDGSLRAEVQAQVQPFAHWPLTALSASTRKIDLNLLSASLPRTSLDADITLRSSGLDKPAMLQAHGTNTLPGRWDQGRLPVQDLDLDLQGLPGQLDRAEIRSLALTLADPDGAVGKVQAQGHWNAGQMLLQGRVLAVQLSRLDARAPAVVLSGPFKLEINGLPQASAGTQSRAEASNQQLTTQLSTDFTGHSLPGANHAPADAVVLELDTQFTDRHWELRRLRARIGKASMQGSASAVRLGTGWAIRSQGHLDQFDPTRWWPGTPGSPWQLSKPRLQGLWLADVAWQPEGEASRPWWSKVAGHARIELQGSEMAGVPIEGKVALKGLADELSVQAALNVAGNRIQAQGSHASTAENWQLEIHAPKLAGMAPLLRLLPDATPWLPAAGELRARVGVRGRWPALVLSGEAQLHAFGSPNLQVQEAELAFSGGAAPTEALDLHLRARGLSMAGQRLDNLDAHVEGPWSSHRLRFSLDSPLRPPSWTEHLLGPAGNGTRLQAQALGGWKAGPGGGQWAWSGLSIRVGARDGAATRDWLTGKDIAGTVHFDADGTLRSAALTPGRIQLPLTGLRWSEARWLATVPSAQWHLSADLEDLDVAPVLARLQPELGWGGALKLGGRIDLHATERFDADVVLERRGGDLHITDELGQPQSLGLAELRIAATAHDGLWQLAHGFAGAQVGSMAGAVVMRGNPQQRWLSQGMPLQGVLQARVAQLGVWGAWVPPGWRLGGALATQLAVGGQVGAPQLSGEMTGTALSLRSVVHGVHLSDGELDIQLDGDRARIRRASIRGAEGLLTLSGSASLGATPSASLQMRADQFRLLGRLDRRIVASGTADLGLGSQELQLKGRFRIDEGYVDLSHADAPALSDDVRVNRPGAAAMPEQPASAPAPAVPRLLRNAQVALDIDLGTRLRLRGRGLDTGLQGALRVSTHYGHVALHGAVRAAGGTYAAYGQKLEIERGEVVFSGPPDNPRLDILAVRPNLDLRVGVAVTGGTQSPRVRLFSEPEQSDFDKLSWLVLGRAPDGLGRTDTALLQRAAVALLAGDGKAPGDNLIESLGLTELSLRQGEGEVRETVVSLGRQLSRRWYVGYERSVNATTGTWQLVYRIAQRFTLRAQSGEQSSLDALWAWRWN